MKRKLTIAMWSRSYECSKIPDTWLIHPPISLLLSLLYLPHNNAIAEEEEVKTTKTLLRFLEICLDNQQTPKS